MSTKSQSSEYLESRGWVQEWRPEEDDPRRWVKDDKNLTKSEALWIEWQDLAQCFAECVVAFRIDAAYGLGNNPAVDALMQASLNKHRIEVRIE